MMKTAVPWAERSGFQARTGDGRLMGPFNPALLNPGIGSSFLALQATEEKYTSLDQRTRQVIILTVGAVWQAAYELYAHSAVGRHAGLPDEAMSALCRGSCRTSSAKRSRSPGHCRCSTRSTRRYHSAVHAFGEAGLSDIVMLTGIYHTVCAILNAFEIPAPEPGQACKETPGMDTEPPIAATLTEAARFPEHYFLENLAVRADNSILVTVVTKKELWYLPPGNGQGPVTPVHVHTFDHMCLGIIETAPGIFHVPLSDAYTTHESHPVRLDLRDWSPGTPVNPQTVLTYPEPVGGLNGSCLIAPGVMLFADSLAGLIWRVDLPEDGGQAAARVWLEHPTMRFDPVSPLRPPQPGINGIRYAAGSGHLYYTATAQQLLMRVAVDQATREPTGEPEVVAGGRMYDDFCLDEDAGVAYVSTHRENTINQIALKPGALGEPGRAVAGVPFDGLLVGPSSLAWGRGEGEAGQVAYVTTDGGGTQLPPDGQLRPARVVRMELPPAGTG